MHNPTNILRKKVEEALLDLAKDEEPLLVVMNKGQAMTLISTVQFAATYPANNALKDLAVSTVKRLEKLFCEDNEVLQDLVDSGWQRKIPKFPAARLIEIMQKVGRREIRFDLSKIEAWGLMGVIQLALRNQDYAQTPAAAISRKTIQPIIDEVITNNLLKAVADSGWDEKFDR